MKKKKKKDQFQLSPLKYSITTPKGRKEDVFRILQKYL